MKNRGLQAVLEQHVRVGYCFLIVNSRGRKLQFRNVSGKLGCRNRRGKRFRLGDKKVLVEKRTRFSFLGFYHWNYYWQHSVKDSAYLRCTASSASRNRVKTRFALERPARF